MKQNGYSRKNFWGEIEHYDAAGNKVGVSRKNFAGGYDHFDTSGNKTAPPIIFRTQLKVNAPMFDAFACATKATPQITAPMNKRTVPVNFCLFIKRTP